MTSLSHSVLICRRKAAPISYGSCEDSVRQRCEVSNQCLLGVSTNEAEVVAPALRLLSGGEPGRHAPFRSLLRATSQQAQFYPGFALSGWVASQPQFPHTEQNEEVGILEPNHCDSQGTLSVLQRTSVAECRGWPHGIEAGAPRTRTVTNAG